MTSDEPILWQHDRLKAYADALAKLTAEGFIYGCACSRKEIQLADEALGLPIGVYPGTCRHGTQERPVRALRFRVPAGNVRFHDRRLGDYLQNVEKTVGDFVLKRADGFWAYQLAVVVDDRSGSERPPFPARLLFRLPSSRRQACPHGPRRDR